MGKHYHLQKQSLHAFGPVRHITSEAVPEAGRGKYVIIEHNHGAYKGYHEHGGMWGYMTTVADAKKMEEVYRHHVEVYRTSLHHNR